MPAIQAIYRYPIKGLTPEPLAAALRPGQTVPGDRIYAIENGPSGFDPAAPAHLPAEGPVQRRPANSPVRKATLCSGVARLNLCRQIRDDRSGRTEKKTLGNSIELGFWLCYYK